ncbi:MAG: CatB-related O-acetyltransferase [Rickettsiales bacterium]|jgi:chloramphenicol O-acetyltransferase type B|nr:CatB-related O-acetyltransferase [Rickettsiales bacterium]
MNPFKHYRESVIIRDNLKCHHITAGEGSYYAGYYHGKNFEECVMYLDEIDNKVDPSEIDKLSIGKYCSIATGVKFMMCGTQGHNYNWIATHPLIDFDNTGFPGHQWKGDTIIGNDVWFGAESLIMPGVKISDGAVIASRAVVTKNIGPYEIWGGNPAKFIKKRFSDSHIEKLLQIKWWDWDRETIKRNLKYLRSADIDGLWKKHLNKEL